MPATKSVQTLTAQFLLNFMFSYIQWSHMTRSLFSGILWLHPCWRSRTSDQSMATVLSGQLENQTHGNHLQKTISKIMILCSITVFACLRNLCHCSRLADDAITERQKMQWFKTTAKCPSILTVPGKSYYSRTF